MTLMHNEFVKKPEIIFICFDDVIKSPSPYVLSKINEKYYPFYKDFLDLDKIKDMSVDQLELFCNKRENKNVFHDLAIVEFDADGSYNELQEKFENMYFDLPFLDMGSTLGMLKTQKFTEKIYIYTKEYDMRIHLDIQKSFNDMKMINYVSGDFDEVIESLEGITSFILDDISYVPSIFFKGKGDYVSIMVANYGYNYYLDEEDDMLKLKINIEEYMKDNTFNFATFSPLTLTMKHFETFMSSVIEEIEEE